MSNLYSDSIFWIETEKIKPNPYQPRREFDEARLQDLAESIKTYGILQPLTVSRVEIEKEEGGLVTEYELIAGERRLRASRIAGLPRVPVIIRVGDSSMMKLELAILENLQREDLNPVERAKAFAKLAAEFKFTHNEIAQKMGRSREYVSNSLRMLSLPDEALEGLSQGKITEGHTRPLLMLSNHPEEQLVLYKEIIYKKLTVREAEKLARRIAQDRIRKKEFIPDPEITEIEEEFQDKLGTRVQIDRKEKGGQIKIDFFSTEDLRMILNSINQNGEKKNATDLLEKHIVEIEVLNDVEKEISDNTLNENPNSLDVDNAIQAEEIVEEVFEIKDDNTQDAELPKENEEVLENKEEEDQDIYNITNFSI